jgi:K+-transporting ATPase KdpF subunit
MCGSAKGPDAVTLPLALAGLTALALLIYLVAVLLRPEKF